jgi:hypothetical protein
MATLAGAALVLTRAAHSSAGPRVGPMATRSTDGRDELGRAARGTVPRAREAGGATSAETSREGARPSLAPFCTKWMSGFPVSRTSLPHRLT